LAYASLSQSTLELKLQVKQLLKKTLDSSFRLNDGIHTFLGQKNREKAGALSLSIFACDAREHHQTCQWQI